MLQWQFHCQKTNCSLISLQTNLLRSCTTSNNSNLSVETIPNAIIFLGTSYSYPSCSSFIIRHHGHWICLPQTDTCINTIALYLVLSLVPAQYYSMERLHLSYHTQQRETHSSTETYLAVIHRASYPSHSPKVDTAHYKHCCSALNTMLHYHMFDLGSDNSRKEGTGSFSTGESFVSCCDCMYILSIHVFSDQ